MAAEPAELADPQPFSPSDFLNLPPTPRVNLDCPALQPQLQDGDGDDDDLMLPFISRVLMEEDIMDGFFDPDHPALLQAQQPFADILSDATKSSGFADSNSNSSSGGAANCSPAAFADATWPYDPVQLSQLLLSTATYPSAATADSPPSSTTMFGGAAATAVDMEMLNLAFLKGMEEANKFLPATTTNRLLMPSAAADSLASTTTMFDSAAGTAVDMDMLNLAFLKGMEDANKFLPAATTNNLLMPVVSGDRDKLWRVRHPPKKTAKPQQGDGDRVSSLLMLQQSATNNGGSRGRKNSRHADDSEEDEAATTTGRRSGKVAAAETEESEMVDEFIQTGYQSLHEQMRAMTMSSTDDSRDAAEKKTSSRKGKKGSATEAVDLRTLLIHCAQAVAGGDRAAAADMLDKIRARASPRGDATQRLAHCFAKGLEARLAGGTTGAQISRRASAVELLRAYQLHLAVCCFTGMAFKFSNMAICNAIAGRKKKPNKVHIVDYGDPYGFQWPTLLGYWGRLKVNGGPPPPEVRITAIDLPEPGFRPAARIQQTGRRLADFARRHGVPFRFHTIAAAKWEEVSAADLGIDADEVLVVNALFHFGKLKDEGADVDSLSPRDMALGGIRRMRPDVFVLGVENSSHNAPFFVTRFREALFYYASLFDMMDAVAPRDSDERVLVEQRLFGRCAMNAVACEGEERVERPETYRKWQVRGDRAGLRQLPLDPNIVRAVRNKVKDKYHKDFVVDVDQQWLLQGWKGRILYAMSTWVANDSSIESYSSQWLLVP